jgi:hypothetical protein
MKRKPPRIKGKAPYFDIDQSGGPFFACDDDPRWDKAFADRMNRENVVLPESMFSPPFTYIADKPCTELEDYLHSWPYNRIISTRLRAFLEEHAPRAIQFLPCDVVCEAGAKPMRYWMCNFLVAVDCMHPDSVLRDKEGNELLTFCTVDPSRIPPDTLIGVIRHHHVTTLVRRDLCQKLIDAGFTGFEFLDITYVGHGLQINNPWDPSKSIKGRSPKPTPPKSAPTRRKARNSPSDDPSAKPTKPRRHKGPSDDSRGT